MTDTLERSAAQWLSRMRADDVTAADQQAFVQWLEGTPGALECYLAQEAIWDLTQSPSCHAVAQDLLAREPKGKAARWRTAFRHMMPKGRFRRAALCASLVLALLGTVSSHALRNVEIHETGVGERQTVALPDGTVLWLNTRSRVKVEFDTGKRQVRLDRGEVFFDVTRDERRPFHVQTPAGTVTVLGTRFNVSASPGRTSVAVLEGAVKIPVERDRASPAPGQPPPPQVITAGQYVSYDPGGASVGRITDHKTAVGWTEGKLYFNSIPLASAIAQYQRYVKQPIVLLEPGLANEIISGVFVIGDLKTFFNALHKSFRLEVKIEDGAIILERPRENPISRAAL